MADRSTAADALLKAAGNDWAVFEELEKETERSRRSILRSHREARLDEDQEIKLRDRVDRALDRVMLLELGLETGVLEGRGDLETIPGLQKLLSENASFVRYLDAYLYFSIRFVAKRLGVKDRDQNDEPVQDDPEKCDPVSVKEEVNELPIAWPVPPDVPLEDDRRASAVQSYLKTLSAEQGDEHTALRFLDDLIVFSSEQAEYELWLRGLAHDPGHDARFLEITRGLLTFVRQKRAFYLSLEDPSRIEKWRQNNRVTGAWSARNPLTARFGLPDLFWLARLLRADLSPSGVVDYADGSWLSLIGAWRKRMGASVPPGIDGPLEKVTVIENGARVERIVDAVELIAECEEVLRGAFDFTCDLVQNAGEIARDRFERRKRPEDFPVWPDATVGWRTVCDEELAEIARQRQERLLHKVPEFEREPPPPAGHGSKKKGLGWRKTASADSEPQKPVDWSRRIKTGEQVSDLVGLAFSGGGIRSATFNLGVLQRLQELDLLRQIDYLSTVSGGGYIGAWLLANVKRTRYWLTQPTDWGPSVDHLRRFSNYLAPRTGLMSADTWTMWGSWIRNAFLIQLSAFTWLAFLLVVVCLGEGLFGSGLFGWRFWDLVLSAGLLVLAPFVLQAIKEQSRSVNERKVLWRAVLPAWSCSFVASGMLWVRAQQPGSHREYSQILLQGWETWQFPLLFLFVGLVWAARWSIDSKSKRTFFSVLWAVVSLGGVYLGLCGVFWLFGRWSSDPSRFVWYAYIFGPPLVLSVLTLGVMLLIGLVGHSSLDWRREWWTRYGSWLGIYGVGFFALGILAIFGPLLTVKAFERETWGTLEWSTVLGWVATVIGGLFAGNSSQSDGESARTWTAKAIGGFARFAAFVFIIGAVLISSLAVHLLLVKVWTPDRAISSSDYWGNLAALGWFHFLASAIVLAVLGALFSWRFEINIFGLNQFYRNRLIRCYLGASRWVPGLRKPHKFTGFDQRDDLKLSELRHCESPNQQTPPFRGPFPIVNCSLNLGGSSDLALHTRHSASFVLTPLRCGSDRRAVGFAPSAPGPGAHACFAGGVDLGQAISVSGAAASPNMGYNTSPLVAFLLTMFNVRLAWWFPNPGKKWWSATWLRLSLWYLVREIFAVADERSYFVNVSDGGHFENLGIYELVRRRCKVIIACDAESDAELSFGSLGRVVRMCQTDFGACINIDVESIRRKTDSPRSRAHCAVGRITYANGSRGCLVYLKASITGDEDVSVQQYYSSHHEFPHETTGDQFFDEEQFESYRRLGHHIAEMVFRGVEREPNLTAMAAKLESLWVPDSAANQGFVDQTQALTELWERLRTDDQLSDLLRELHCIQPLPQPRDPTAGELAVCLELIQLMENAFLDLRLDEFWEHPDNRGWQALFTMWAQSPKFRKAYRTYERIFGIRFAYFCHHRLGL